MGYGKRLWRKVTSVLDKKLTTYRRNRLNNQDFSIICNNCWGGYVYRRYGLPYHSPTVGLFFFAEDFIRLCENLKYYMELDLVFIRREDSKYAENLKSDTFKNVPIGKLDDIEVVFLHYKTEEEAREKWNRRKARIHYDNLIFKFSKMNACTEAHLAAFDQLEANKKLCFVPYKTNYSSAIYFPVGKGQENISDDTSEYSRYLNLEKLINSSSACGNNYRSNE